MTSGNARAGPEKSSEGKKHLFWGEPVPSGGPGAGDADGYTLAAGAVCSSLARAAEPIPLAEDGARHSPDAVWPWRFRSIGTARATDTDDSHECWPHIPRAGSHRLLGGVHAAGVRSQQDTAGSHRV